MKTTQRMFLTLAALIASVMLPGAVMAQGMIMQRPLAPVVVGGEVELPLNANLNIGGYQALPALNSDPIKVAELDMPAVIVGIDPGAMVERKAKVALTAKKGVADQFYGCSS